MKRYAIFSVFFTFFYCFSSSLDNESKNHASELQKVKKASKTLVSYGLPVTAYDFLKKYSLYYQAQKNTNSFSPRQALYKVGRSTARTAAKRAVIAFPFLMIFESVRLNVELRKKELPE